MRINEFGVSDVEDYLNQELPGFEPSVVQSDMSGVTLRVRGAVRFAGYADLGSDAIFPLGDGWRLRQTVDEFVRRTRDDAIRKFGLEKRIDERVKQEVQRQIERIRHEEFEKAYSKAMTDAEKGRIEAEDARARRMWNAFMGRDDLTPTEEDSK